MGFYGHFEELKNDTLKLNEKYFISMELIWKKKFTIEM